MNLDFIKKCAKKIKKDFEIKHGQALDLCSAQLGYDSWNHLCADAQNNEIDVNDQEFEKLMSLVKES